MRSIISGRSSSVIGIEILGQVSISITFSLTIIILHCTFIIAAIATLHQFNFYHVLLVDIVAIIIIIHEHAGVRSFLFELAPLVLVLLMLILRSIGCSLFTVPALIVIIISSLGVCCHLLTPQGYGVRFGSLCAFS